MREAGRRLRDAVTGFPFTSRNDRRLIVHCCYHKVGTIWFENVFRGVGAHFGLTARSLRQEELTPATDIFLERHSAIDVAKLPPFRGSHIIRDPRDIVVSGYFYHLRCTEPWALEPDERLGGRSYQELLLALDEEAGIRTEMEAGFARRTLAAMAAWDYRQRAFLELRYEDFIADEDGQWERLFLHYGFRAGAARKAAVIARRYSLASGRYREWRKDHVRSGQPGEWRAHFTDMHRGVFRDLFGDLLQQRGYERDDDW